MNRRQRNEPDHRLNWKVAESNRISDLIVGELKTTYDPQFKQIGYKR